PAEDLLFQLVESLGKMLDNGEVSVDDGVEQGMGSGPRISDPFRVGGPGRRDLIDLGDFPIVDRDEKMLAYKKMDLVQPETAPARRQSQRIERREEVGRIALDLGPLPATKRVLDGEMVKAQPVAEKLGFGLARVRDVEPDELA